MAKRNFRVRHAHFQNARPTNAGKADDKADEKDSKKRKAKSQEASSSTDDSLTTQSPDADDGEPARVNDDDNAINSSRTRTQKKRQKVWAKMLDHLPSSGDEDNKTEWLARVLLVSDEKTPRKELRSDITPRDDTKEMAAMYLEKARKPRRKRSPVEKTAEV